MGVIVMILTNVNQLCFRNQFNSVKRSYGKTDMVTGEGMFDYDVIK